MDAFLYFLCIAVALAVGGAVHAKISSDFEDVRTEAKRMRQEEQQAAALSLADKLTALSPLDEPRRERLDLMCERAGYRFDGTTWNGICVMALIGGAVAALFTLLFVGSGATKVALMAVCVAAGWGIPRLAIENAGRNRSRKIEHGMAGALELLSVTVKAGYPLERGIKLLGRELDGPVGEEFARVDTDVNYLNMPIERSLRRMADRCDSYTVSSFANAVINAVQQGTAISRVLEAQAHTAREERFNDLLVEINKIPTKMVPVMYFLFMPAIIVLALAPPIYNTAMTFTDIDFGYTASATSSIR